MKVARSLQELKERAPRASAVTIGVFDGVHRGHQRILEELIARRDDGRVESAWAITFDPHPLMVTRSREAPPLLTTIDERLELLSRLPLDGTFVLPFDEGTARVTCQDLGEQCVLVAMGMRDVVRG
jgi:riboflavin kinase/FMN adenylyltransferase